MRKAETACCVSEDGMAGLPGSGVMLDSLMTTFKTSDAVKQKHRIGGFDLEKSTGFHQMCA